MIFLLVATFLNVAPDILFVASFGMGVGGVAFATVIAQMVSAVLCLMKLKKLNDSFELSWPMLKLTSEHSLNVVRLGLPSELPQAIFLLP